jgi:hypothetical protein
MREYSTLWRNFIFLLLQDAVHIISTAFCYHRRSFRMRADWYLWLCETSHQRNRTESDGARLPVLVRTLSGGEPRTWQNLQPCFPSPSTGRCKIPLQLCKAVNKGVPLATRRMGWYTTQYGIHVPTFQNNQPRYIRVTGTRLSPNNQTNWLLRVEISRS